MHRLTSTRKSKWRVGLFQVIHVGIARHANMSISCFMWLEYAWLGLIMARLDENVVYVMENY